MKSAEAFLAELSKQTGSDLGLSNHASSAKTTAAKRTPVRKNAAIDEVVSDIEFLKKQIEAKAVALLAVREQGSRELKQKLLGKFVETPELLANLNEPAGLLERLVDEIVHKCQKNNWQSDDRYLEQAVNSYLDKGQGPLKIKQKLQAKCSDSSLIDAYLDLDEGDWVEIARTVLEKKYGDCSKPASQNEQAKRMRFLQSRGFYQGVIWKAFA